MSFTIAVNVLEEEIEECTKFCTEKGLGIEITSFASPHKLEGNIEDSIRYHKKFTSQVKTVSFHGPFLDLYVTSPDPEIVEVCRKRHQKALDAAIELDSSLYIAHLNSIPIISNKTYMNNFVSRSAEFWKPFADKASENGIVIALENMWEKDPHLQLDVINTANHKSLKASFDNGHALVFSQVDASGWIEQLGDHLAHCHLHDNDMKYDHHWPISKGKEHWDTLIQALKENAPKTAIVLESDTFEANKESFKELKSLLNE